MKRKSHVHILYAITLLCLCILLFLPVRAATYRQGSKGDTVRTIQTKLKRWGYYSGTVDGVYGKQTAEAVKYFQRQNGLTADGVCGSGTQGALLSGSAVSGLSSISNNMKCRVISPLVKLLALNAR